MSFHGDEVEGAGLWLAFKHRNSGSGPRRQPSCPRHVDRGADKKAAGQLGRPMALSELNPIARGAACGHPRAAGIGVAGGVIGAFALLSNVILVPRTGMGALIGLVIAGQLLSSLAIDHFALMGSAHRPVSLIKLAGALVMLVGILISLFGDRWSRLVA